MFVIGTRVRGDDGRLGTIVSTRDDGSAVVEYDDGGIDTGPVHEKAPDETPEERRQRENIEAGRHPNWVSIEEAPPECHEHVLRAMTTQTQTLFPGFVDDGGPLCLPRLATKRNLDRKTLGKQVANFAAALETPLMPWQRYVADVSLELDERGMLVYRNVGLTVPRQSGKTTLLEALILQRAFKWERQTMKYTAQTQSAARDKVFDDWMPILIDSQFSKRIHFRMTNGHEQLQFDGGSTLGILPTTMKAGHGSTLDMVLLDEAFALSDTRMDQNLRAAMRTRPEPQFWIVSTAGWQDGSSPYLEQRVKTGRNQVADGLDTGSCYFEWSADDDDDPSDEDVWWRASPALGRTVAIETMRDEYNTIELIDFRRSMLNQWVATKTDPVIPMRVWESLIDSSSEPYGPVALALDVSPDREWSSVSVGGKRRDGMYHVEVVHRRRGTGWVPQVIADFWHNHRPVGIWL